MKVYVALVWCAVGCASQFTSCPDVGLVAGESKCTSCSEVSVCADGRSSSVVCRADQACFQDAGSASCQPVDDTPCSGCDEDSHTACDPYNDMIVNSCARGRAPQLLEICPGTQTCFKGSCVDGPKPSSRNAKVVPEACDELIEDDHFVVIKPQCEIGVLCSRNESGAIVYECDEGRYFDPMTVSCEFYPVDNCVATFQGFAPDRTNCTRGVVCEYGREVSSFSCGDTHVYDADTDTCVDENAPHSCPTLEGCELQQMATL